MHRVTVLVIAALVALGIIAAGAAAAGPTRIDGEWIVVDHSDFDTHTGDIVLMRPDGSSMTVLASETEDTCGELSPDGTAIVFTSVDTGGLQSIWLMDVDGTNRRRLTEGFARSATWTPDGASIVYTAGRELRIIGRNSADDRLVAGVDDNAISGPAVSPDGTTVAFAVSIDNVRYLHTVPIVGGDTIQITADSGFEPEWAPDSTRILFTTFRPDAGGNIWATNPDGSDPENLVPSPSNDFHGTWSPDSARVAFEAVRSGEVTVSVYDRVDGTTEDLLSAPIDGPTYRRPSWTEVTLDAVVVAPPPETTTTTAAVTDESTTTTTVAAETADPGTSTNWLVIGLVVAIVGLAGFGIGVVVGGRYGARPAPPPPPPEDDTGQSV